MNRRDSQQFRALYSKYKQNILIAELAKIREEEWAQKREENMALSSINETVNKVVEIEKTPGLIKVSPALVKQINDQNHSSIKTAVNRKLMYEKTPNTAATTKKRIAVHETLEKSGSNDKFLGVHTEASKRNERNCRRSLSLPNPENALKQRRKSYLKALDEIEHIRTADDNKVGKVSKKVAIKESIKRKLNDPLAISLNNFAVEKCAKSEIEIKNKSIDKCKNQQTNAGERLVKKKFADFSKETHSNASESFSTANSAMNITETVKSRSKVVRKDRNANNVIKEVSKRRQPKRLTTCISSPYEKAAKKDI